MHVLFGGPALQLAQASRLRLEGELSACGRLGVVYAVQVERAHVARLAEARGRAERALAATEVRYGSLSVEFVDARRELDEVRAALRQARVRAALGGLRLAVRRMVAAVLRRRSEG